MFEAAIILPLRDNAGAPVDAAHDSLAADLLSAFGGFTTAPVSGAWRDETGKLYRDQSTEYRVAADWAKPRLADRLERIAESAGRLAGQLAVYVRHGDGRVAFVEPFAEVRPSVSRRERERLDALAEVA